MKSDQSVPLSEALQHFSDPSDWDELISLEPYAIAMIMLGAPETEDERRHWRYHQLKKRLETQFLAKLRAGTLRASGFVWPKGLKPRRRTIPRTRWQELEPDFAASEARGDGLRVVNVQVRTSRPARNRSSRRSPMDEHGPGEHASLARLRTELRRWLQREARSRGTGWQKETLPRSRTYAIWRSGDQQPLQGGLAVG